MLAVGGKSRDANYEHRERSKKEEINLIGCRLSEWISCDIRILQYYYFKYVVFYSEFHLCIVFEGIPKCGNGKMWESPLEIQMIY